MAITLPSRGLRGYAGGFLAGCVSMALFGIGFTYADTLVVLIAYMAAVPLFIAGLGAGTISGAFACIVGTVVLLVTRPTDFAMLYAVAFGLPVSVLIGLALRHDGETISTTKWYPETNIFTGILLYPCIAFLAACAAAQGHGGLLAETQAGMVGAISEIKDQLKDHLDAGQMQQFLEAMNHFARLLPSLLGIFWILIMSFSIIVAQSTLKQQDWNLRPILDSKFVGLPKWTAAIAVVAGIASVYAPAPFDYIGLNIGILFAFGFIAVGLMVIHAYAAQYKYGSWALLVFYILLSLKWTMLPLVAITLFLGLTDQWIDFRRRFAGLKQGG